MTKQGQRMNERMREALLHTPAYPCYCFAYAKTTNVLDRLRANTQCHHRWFSYSSTRHRHLDESRAKRDLTNIKASQAEWTAKCLYDTEEQEASTLSEEASFMQAMLSNDTENEFRVSHPRTCRSVSDCMHTHRVLIQIFSKHSLRALSKVFRLRK